MSAYLSFDLLKKALASMLKAVSICIFGERNNHNVETSHEYLSMLLWSNRAVRIRLSLLITQPSTPSHISKIRQVAYNPKKGLSLTLQIMPYVADTPFIPLISITESQVSEPLKKSMDYIDLGGHSGKDRIPREVVISQCYVIVASTGTAGVFQGVPISRQYKMDIIPFEPKMIGSFITKVLDRYDELPPDFEMYRHIISMERKAFSREIQAIFGSSC